MQELLTFSLRDNFPKPANEAGILQEVMTIVYFGAILCDKTSLVEVIVACYQASGRSKEVEVTHITSLAVQPIPKKEPSYSIQSIIYCFTAK